MHLLTDISFRCILGKVDRLRRVNHELLELINEKSGNLEKALKNYVQDEDLIPMYRSDSRDSMTIEYAARKDDMKVPLRVPLKAADLVPREINHVGPRSVLPTISSADPALLLLQQYNIANDTSSVSREKATRSAQLAAQMRQDLFGKKVKKSTTTYPFEEDKDTDTDIDIEACFSTDNPGLDVFRTDAKKNTNRDGTAIMSPDEPSPSNTSHPQRMRESTSAASLHDLENQREVKNYPPAGGNTENRALTMVVTHHVKWERTLEFENWTKDMFQKM